MRKMREIAKICLIVENTGLDPLCRWAPPQRHAAAVPSDAQEGGAVHSGVRLRGDPLAFACWISSTPSTSSIRFPANQVRMDNCRAKNAYVSCSGRSTMATTASDMGLRTRPPATCCPWRFRPSPASGTSTETSCPPARACAPKMWCGDTTSVVTDEKKEQEAYPPDCPSRPTQGPWTPHSEHKTYS